MMIAFGSIAANAQTLEIARNEAASPVSDGAERVMQEAGRRAGISITIRPMPLTRSSILANEAEIDGELARIADVTRLYPNLVSVPTPISWNLIAAYGYAKDIDGKTFEQLQKLRIGIIKGSPILKKNTATLDVREAQGTLSVFRLLHNKQIDLAVLSYTSAELELAQEKITDISRWPYYWTTEPLFFTLHKKNTRFVEPLNNALLSMTKEGMIEKIFKESLRKNNISPLKNR